MKRLFLLGLIQLVGLCTSTLADGYILFRNRIVGEFDAPIHIGQRTNQAFFRASLHLIGNGTVERLFPETNFNHGPPPAADYLVPVVVRVPNKQPGDTVSVEVRVEAADPGLNQVGASQIFDVTLGTREAPGKPVQMTSFLIPNGIPFCDGPCDFPSGEAQLEAKVRPPDALSPRTRRRFFQLSNGIFRGPGQLVHTPLLHPGYGRFRQPPLLPHHQTSGA